MSAIHLARLAPVLLLAWFAAGCASETAGDESGFYLEGYPDWRGQWARIGSLNWHPDGYAQAGPPPLTPEYQAIWARYTELQQEGIPAGDHAATCLPPGMPRVMTMSFPMEIIVTPEVTYIYAEWNSQVRRVFTDGRDWPEDIIPSFNGYSIGQWHDENGDGVYDVLAVETRGIKGPRSFDSLGVPLHENDQTVVLEQIRQVEPDVLENRITTIDDALTEPWTVQRRYRRETGDVEWIEYVCVENQRHMLIGDEWYFLDAENRLQPTRAGQPRLVPENQAEANGN